MDPTKIPKGQSPESYTDGRLVNQPGIYKHHDTGAEFITFPGEEGVLQADALMSPVWKDKWERIGDVPSRAELDKRRRAQLLTDTKREAREKAEEEAELKAAAEEGTREGSGTDAAPEAPVGGQTYIPEPKKEPAKEPVPVK